MDKEMEKQERNSISSHREQENEIPMTINGRPILDLTNLVYLLIDTSGSMSGNNLQQAKDGAKELANDARSKGYQIGLIAFSSSAICLFDPRLGRANFDLYSRIDSMNASGGTDMTGAIEMAIEKLGSAEYGLKGMIIATDGQPNSKGTALAAAKKAKGLGIMILAVGTSGADVNFLQQIATSDKLAVKVPVEQFKKAISSTALALPEKTNIKKL